MFSLVIPLISIWHQYHTIAWVIDLFISGPCTVVRDLFQIEIPSRDEYKTTARNSYTLQWRHNGRDSVSKYQPRNCLLNRLFRRRSKKTSKLHVTGLCAGNSPGTGEFPAHKWPVTRKMFSFGDVIMAYKSAFYIETGSMFLACTCYMHLNVKSCTTRDQRWVDSRIIIIIVVC